MRTSTVVLIISLALGVLTQAPVTKAAPKCDPAVQPVIEKFGDLVFSTDQLATKDFKAEAKWCTMENSCCTADSLAAAKATWEKKSTELANQLWTMENFPAMMGIMMANQKQSMSEDATKASDATKDKKPATPAAKRVLQAVVNTPKKNETVGDKAADNGASKAEWKKPAGPAAWRKGLKGHAEWMTAWKSLTKFTYYRVNVKAAAKDCYKAVVETRAKMMCAACNADNSKKSKFTAESYNMAKSCMTFGYWAKEMSTVWNNYVKYVKAAKPDSLIQDVDALAFQAQVDKCMAPGKAKAETKNTASLNVKVTAKSKSRRLQSVVKPAPTQDTKPTDKATPKSDDKATPKSDDKATPKSDDKATPKPDDGNDGKWDDWKKSAWKTALTVEFNMDPKDDKVLAADCQAALKTFAENNTMKVDNQITALFNNWNDRFYIAINETGDDKITVADFKKLAGKFMKTDKPKKTDDAKKPEEAKKSEAKKRNLQQVAKAPQTESADIDAVAAKVTLKTPDFKGAEGQEAPANSAKLIAGAFFALITLFFF